MDLTKVKDRLATLGYTSTDADNGLITYIGVTVENSTKVVLNIAELPTDVENIIIDKICGEFLLNKKSAGQLEGIELDNVIELKEGDTTVKVDKSSTASAQVDSLISWLISGRDHVLLSYRCIVW